MERTLICEGSLHPSSSLWMELGTPFFLSDPQFFDLQSGTPSWGKRFPICVEPEAPGVSTEERARFFGSLVCGAKTSRGQERTPDVDTRNLGPGCSPSGPVPSPPASVL